MKHPQVDNYFMTLAHSRALRATMEQVFLHTYPDIQSETVQQLLETLRGLDYQTSDIDVFTRILSWRRSLTTEQVIGFPMSDDDYQKHKANRIAAAISSTLTPANNKSALLDIGAGDCAMTYLVSQALQLSANAIDVQSDMDWGGSNNSSTNENLNKYKNNLDAYYTYDGKNLLAPLHGKTFKVIMYNHSLHHFQSFKEQRNSLRQACSLLENGGVLFLSEHTNCLEEDLFDLCHILLHMRYSFDKNPAQTEEDIKNILDIYKSTYVSHYFSQTMIQYIASECGCDLAQELSVTEADISKRTFFTFIKNEHSLRLKTNHRFFDAEMAKTTKTPFTKKHSEQYSQDEQALSSTLIPR